MDKFKLGMIIFGIVNLAFLVWFIQIDFLMPEGYNFCNDKGYERTSFGGSYSERFGKVKCVSCYDGNCSYEEFNVTSKFGIIVEVPISDVSRNGGKN